MGTLWGPCGCQCGLLGSPWAHFGLLLWPQSAFRPPSILKTPLDVWPHLSGRCVPSAFPVDRGLLREAQLGPSPPHPPGSTQQELVSQKSSKTNVFNVCCLHFFSATFKNTRCLIGLFMLNVIPGPKLRPLSGLSVLRSQMGLVLAAGNHSSRPVRGLVERVNSLV